MSFRPSLLYLPTLMISVWMGLLTSCQNPVSPGYDPGAFKLEEGFSLKLVAGPDLVRTPVAMDQDVQGRLWVLEMPGYMADLASSTEEAAVGKIKILTDENGDGIFDRSASFLDSLVLARALLLVYDGLLYAEPPNLWFVPILEGDQAGPKELVDSVYATGGNVEHQANSLTYNLDNWIYNAKSTFRYQRKNGVWKKERTAFRGQWGLSRDDVGRLYSNNNSRTLVADMVSPAFFKPYPGLQLSHLYNQEIDTSFRVYPLHPTAVNRGYIPGVLDSAGLLQRVTSACGPLVYRGHQFPETYQNRAFVCTPEANALQAYQLSEQGPRLQAMHASPGREFLASTEEIFRPVNAYNNARGTLYINDIHQGIIQHFTYMTSYLRNQLQASGLDSAAQGGRIWEISYQAEQAPSMPRLVGRPMQDWVELLRHPNGWIRDKAQAYLVHQGDAAAVPELVALIEGHQANPLGALHAMWTLEGMGALTAAHLL
ncbi:MAG: dehydrogenase, partial [Bacteroidota bacterium]